MSIVWLMESGTASLSSPGLFDKSISASRYGRVTVPPAARNDNGHVMKASQGGLKRWNLIAKSLIAQTSQSRDKLRQSWCTMHNASGEYGV